MRDKQQHRCTSLGLGLGIRFTDKPGRRHLVTLPPGQYWRFVYFLTAALLWVTPLRANTITAADVERLQAMVDRVAIASSEVASSGRAIVKQTLESGDVLNSHDRLLSACLLELKGVSEHIGFLLHESLVTLGISSVARDPTDEGISLSSAKPSITVLLNYLPSARMDVSEIQVSCRASPLVSSKAQLILGLIPSIDREISSLAKRIHAVRP
jgi:hypothetical protein